MSLLTVAVDTLAMLTATLTEDVHDTTQLSIPCIVNDCKECSPVLIILYFTMSCKLEPAITIKWLWAESQSSK